MFGGMLHETKFTRVRPARPALPGEKFIENYNGERWNARDYARFVNSFVKWERENAVS